MTKELQQEGTAGNEQAIKTITYNSNIFPIPTHFSPSGVQGVGA